MIRTKVSCGPNWPFSNDHNKKRSYQNRKPIFSPKLIVFIIVLTFEECEEHILKTIVNKFMAENM